MTDTVNLKRLPFSTYVSVIGFVIFDLIKNGALSDVYVIALERADDAADLTGSDEAALQVLRVRIDAVQIVQGALAGQRFAALLIQDRLGILDCTDLEADPRGEAVIRRM